MDEKLINSIKAGDLEESINAFIEFMCGGRREAHNMVILIESGLLMLSPEGVQMIGALTLKLSALALKYEEENKT